MLCYVLPPSHTCTHMFTYLLVPLWNVGWPWLPHLMTPQAGCPAVPCAQLPEWPQGEQDRATSGHV